ncbi:RHS repeat-associated core domain-containing protein [Streptomyces sp. NPDC003952]
MTWPAPGSAEVDLSSGSASKAFLAGPLRTPTADTGAGQAGKLPVAVYPGPGKAAESPVKVKVSVAAKDAARKAGVDGLMLSVGRSDGSARPGSANVEVDYDSFRWAYGGDWAARLHLVELPSCALTTPQLAECRTQTPLQTRNDTRSGKLTAQVAIPGTAGAQSAGLLSKSVPATGPVPAARATVLAATAGDAGPTGDYKATSLQASGSWNAGGSTGAFSWSYGVNTPTVPGGLTPKISLGYNSQSVDGRTGAANSQASWIGDGWAWEPGFIERKYKPCNDDQTGGTNTAKVGDQCWFNDNATLSLGGKSTELVFEQGKGWHPASDSGEKIEKLTGASNGDKGTADVDGVGEHWKVTTTDGTQYFFGLNRLPGWKDNGDAADDPLTNSTWTAPVFGNQSGEPCYNASFASAWCQQAWRWQLDYVVEPGGDAMAYYWRYETNNYERNVSSTTGKGTVTPYIRGGWLDHIDYGLRNDTVYTAKALGQVTFGVAQRCFSGCTAFDETYSKNWKDVPFDLYCANGSADCKGQSSPSFWSRVRLKDINTKILIGGAYQDVDSWTLDQDFPPSGDGISTPLWLKSITRTAKAGAATDIALAPVTFTGEQRPNRVDATGDGLAPYVRLRMSQVNTETGGTIGVTYSQPDCTTATLPAADGTNTTRCYPVKWAWEGETTKIDWFNSYVVTQVVEGDNIASSPDKVTAYRYVGTPAWAKAEDEFIKAEDRVHSVFRGYGLIQTRTGTASDPKTLTVNRYFRGLDGKNVVDGTGAPVVDRPEFAGMTRETAVYEGDDTTKLVNATASTPWRAPTATATRVRPGLPDLVSYKTGTEKEATRTTVTGGTRTTETSRHFDAYGMVDWESASGDTAVTGDESCTTTTYARNTTTWILDRHSRVETVAVPCGTAASKPADVISDTRTYFDNGTLGTVPGSGLVTKTETINGKGDDYDVQATVPLTCGAAKNQLCYDVYGRQLATADTFGKVTKIAYTPAAGGPLTSMVVTNPLGHTVTSDIDPLRSQPTKVTDANGKLTTTEYDALGRTTRVWLPNWTAADNPDKPSRVFEYAIANDAPNVVTSKTLTHDYQYSTVYSIYDGLLRERQTQTQSPDLSGRLVTETFYDTRGQAWRNSGVYYANGAPSADLVTGAETAYPASTDTLFDGAGRTTAVISKKFGTETKRTTTSYTGDTTTVVPPQGGIATTTVTDGLGRTVEQRQYTNAARTTSQSTKYGYNKLGQLEQVTDPANVKWTYTYDVRGRQVETDDPDRGLTKTAYDQGNRVTDVTDATGVTLHTDYDALGRVVSTKQGSTVLTAQVYDTVAKGQPTKSTRYVGGKAYESEILTYNDLYQPLTTEVTIPSTPDTGALAGTYSWTNSYNISGQVLTTKQPALGDLPAETVGSTYKTVSGLLNSMAAGNSRLVTAMTYDHYGRAIRQELGSAGQRLYRSTEYDEHTGALSRVYTDRDVAPQRIEDTKYTNDPAGNLTSIATAYGQDALRTTDTQCVDLDALRRITQAWTNKGETCAASPSATALGGTDQYWTTYTYDAVGNRKTETQHKTASGPTADTIRTYATPTAGKHDLPKVTQTGTDPHDETFTYDALGNTKTRKSGTGETQYLDWDPEGHLKTVKQGTSTSSYLYDSGGQRLLRKDSTGTTLYLPAGNELKLDKAGKITGTRYYGGVAMRTGGKLTFTVADHHNTGTTQVTADAAQTVTRRKTGIFGDDRGTQPANWAGEKGFVGGTKDTETGLTHLGAREYDPTIGRFISVDPIMDLSDAQQLHGYTYSNNNPVSLSDPSGLRPDGVCGGNTSRCASDHDRSGATTDYHESWEYKGNGGWKWSSWITQTKKGKKDKVYGGIGYGDWYDMTPRKLAFSRNTIPGMGRYFASSLDFFNPLTRFGLTAGGGYDSLMEELGVDTSDPAYEDGEGIPEMAGLVFGGVGKSFLKNAKKLCHSFLPGTEVLMADGSRKEIQDIEVGDVVFATDPQTGESYKKTVLETIRTEDDKDFTELTVATEDGPAAIVTTDTHPFWVPDLAEWVNAGDLQVGTTLRTSTGKHVEITALNTYTKRQRTHDLTISDVHTYYVLAGATPVLVHNCGTGSISNSRPGDLGLEMMEADFAGISPMAAGSSDFSRAASEGGRFLWTVGEAGNLNMVRAAPGIHHTVASGGAPVIGAGQVTFRNGGAISSFDNFTGHYTPPCAQCAAAFIERGVDAFAGAGIRVPLTVIRDYGGRAP